MAIHFTCPHCGLQSEVDEQFAGKTGPCKQCGAMVAVPALALNPHVAPAPRSSTSPLTILTLFIVLGVSLVMLLTCGGVLAALLLPAVHQARESGRRNTCSNNLRQIALAMHNYADVYGTFPPAYVPDADGKPKHSWRVLILSFLGEQPLYDRYRFDEPWDGPNNRQLAAEMPGVYHCPSDVPGSENTSYVVATGPGTLFEEGKSATPGEIQHRASTTLLAAEITGPAIHWMEPRDLDSREMSYTINDSSGVGISSSHASGANIVFADGRVRFVSESIDSETLRALTTSDAKIEVPPEF